MKKIIPFFIVFLSVNLVNAQYYGKIEKQGYFNCFDTVVTKDNGKPFTCEPSTIAFINGKIFIGNDKTFPYQKSSIFSFNFDDTINCKSRTYYENDLFDRVHKFEASTITPDSNFLIFSGAFDYHENHPKEGTFHNTAIFFSPKNIEKGGVLHIKGDTGTNSIDIKKYLRRAIKSDSFPEGPDYLKVEGLSIIPNNFIIFGIREFGKSYKDFNYSIIFVITHYTQDENGIYLDTNFRKILDYKPQSRALMRPVGLSSIEYNPYDGNIWFTTSYELGKLTWQLGAYMWYLSPEELFANKTPHLLTDQKGRPFVFKHKIEGFTFINKETILLIADDDRTTGKYEKDYSFLRNLNQAYWCILKIKK